MADTGRELALIDSVGLTKATLFGTIAVASTSLGEASARI
jgi:hypothetical protein